MATNPRDRQDPAPRPTGGAPSAPMVVLPAWQREKRLRWVARHLAARRPEYDVSVSLEDSGAKVRVVHHGRTLLRVRVPAEVLDSVPGEEMAEVLATVPLEADVPAHWPVWLSWSPQGLVPG